MLTRFEYNLECSLPPHELFQHWKDVKGTLFLDSSDNQGHSFICLNPEQKFTFKINDNVSKPINKLRKFLSSVQINKNQKALRHFTGGLAGYISYDIRKAIERFEDKAVDELDTPDVVMNVYTQVIVYNHQTKSYTLYVHATDVNNADKTAKTVFEFCTSPPPALSQNTPIKDWQKDFTKTAYEQTIQRVIDYIYAGDIFQACIAQRFTSKLPEDYSPYSTYLSLRNNSPAPYSGYLNYDDFVIFTNSPERFLSVQNNVVETKPIKGTMPRGDTPETDKENAETLLASEKDKAENAMIVDILRNDLHKVCEPSSVQVPKLNKLESYANVHHLVSTVLGELRKDKDIFDLLEAALPGGSISGAPKIRAMEIIEEVEPVRRGPYCGCMGTIDFNGAANLNILIRTAIIKDNKAHIYAGGGIVADSSPKGEYQETLDKASHLIKAFGS